MGYLANEDKNNGITIIAKRNEEAEYLYADSMAIEGTRPECCWQVIKVASNLQKEIHQMLLLRITSGKSID